MLNVDTGVIVSDMWTTMSKFAAHTRIDTKAIVVPYHLVLSLGKFPGQDSGNVRHRDSAQLLFVLLICPILYASAEIT
jgi:hypothetical protein